MLVLLCLSDKNLSLSRLGKVERKITWEAIPKEFPFIIDKSTFNSLEKAAFKKEELSKSALVQDASCRYLKSSSFIRKAGGIKIAVLCFVGTFYSFLMGISAHSFLSFCGVGGKKRNWLLIALVTDLKNSTKKCPKTFT